MGASPSKEFSEPLIGKYLDPSDRKKQRQLRNYPTDAAGAQFDPTADKHVPGVELKASWYDYLLIFRRPAESGVSADGHPVKPEDAERVSWCDVETLWFQAIPGDEDKKLRGLEWLRGAWRERFRTDTVSNLEGGDSVPAAALQGLIREHVVDVLGRKAGLQLKMTISSSGKEVLCQVRAPLALLERKADELNYKLQFRGEVDPGPDFWQKWSDQDADGNEIYQELAEEAVLYEKNEANEILEDLYRAGKVGPSDMAVFDESEPTAKHWSRRVHTLERIADRVPVSNRYPAYADFVTDPDKRHLYNDYPSVRGRTLFLPKDRLYLTRRILDENYDFGVLGESGMVEACLALHDANYGETPTLAWFVDHWVLFWRAPAGRAGAPMVSMRAIDSGEGCSYWMRPWAQPLMEIRAYFGEQVALYFAWLGFYGFSLLWPALASLVVAVYETIMQVSDEAEGIHYQQIALAFFLVVWSAYYKESWDVEQKYCAVKWGTVDFEEDEADRPQFVGDPECPRRLSPITNQNETYYPEAKRFRLQLFGYTVVAALTAGLIMVIGLCFVASEMLEDVGQAALAQYLLPVVFAGLIQSMSRLYHPVAYRLNDAENYKTQTAYDNNLVLKVFGFEIFNNFGALAGTAYFKGPWTGGCVSGNDNCLGDLKLLLIAIFFVRFSLALASACGGRWCASDDSTDEVAQKNPFHEESKADAEDPAADEMEQLDNPRFAKEAELDPYEGLFDEYAEIVLQMGLVCMFSLGWYFAPALAAVEILLQLRVDAHALASLSQRPPPMPAETVGSWGLLMDAMSLLSVFTNAGIVVYTTHSFRGWSYNQKVCAFFVLEQLLLVAKMLAHVFVSDLPPELSDIIKRQAFVVNRHKNVVFEDDLDDDDADGIKRGHVDRSEVRAQKKETTTQSAALNAFQDARISYLSEKLKAVESDVAIARTQYKSACRTEVFSEETGVSYSRRTPGLALGMVSLTVLEAEGVGGRHDPCDPRHCRVIVHVRDPTPKRDRPYEGAPGPAPQVSKPAKKPPKSPQLSEELRSAGVRMVFNQAFSLAPVKTSKAELYIEIMDHSKRVRRGTTTVALSDLSNQRKQALTLSIARPAAAEGSAAALAQYQSEAAVLYVKAQFQYSRILPIKRRIYMLPAVLLDERRKLQHDRTNLRLGKPCDNEWDFPDAGPAEEAKEE